MDLKHMIRERGYRLSWVAEQIGISNVQFSRMIHGTVTIPDDKVGALALLLKVRKSDLARIAADANHKGVRA